ncbi:DUF4214 domain-containing protein [Pseudoroseomonas ludipueritiae]|uniref:DUF4214 domain-containing protein n=1 Tax=Pseudoroseomonas ludipueritiae TaxID=198093 RepID=A0ABR7R5L6_9PROT|nr:DUF4214 domain-containing protein [Pseudoroseomonas ludipueritiae]
MIELVAGAVSFGATTDAAFLSRLYGGLFGRGGDASGLSFWAHGNNGALSKADVAAGFLASTEYLSGHAGLNDDQFVQDLYQAVLGRAGEADGIAFHRQAMMDGASRAQILANFADSPEAQEHWSDATSSGIFVPGQHAGLIRAAYAAAFGREAEASGLTWHGQAMAGGLTIAQFGDAVTSSEEFVALHGGQSDHDLVAGLYVNGLGREGSAQEIAFYEDLLASQALDRGDVVLAFAASQEAQDHLQWML